MPTYEELRSRCLEAIPDEIDKREGSLIDTAIAPVCAELAAAYVNLENYFDLLFPDTSEGEYLERIGALYGVARGDASPATLRAVFTGQDEQPFDPPVGMRFSIDGVYYILTECKEGTGSLVCETAGEVGNQLGEVLPGDYLTGFGKAEAVEILTPGENREDDTSLRERILELLAYPAFGGNVSDYKEKVRLVPGVGGVRVQPVFLGSGTVGVQVLGSDLMPAGDALIQAVQTLLVPDEDGDGLGMAPIGHLVLVYSPTTEEIAVSAKVTASIDLAQARQNAENAAGEYLLGLRKSWEDGDPVVRFSGMMAAISAAEGIVDVENLTINGGTENIVCSGVPVNGAFTFTMFGA